MCRVSEEGDKLTVSTEQVERLILIRQKFSNLSILRGAIYSLYPMAAQQNNFWKKCSNGKLEEVREALQAGADPNTRGGSYNRTCLMEAIYNDRDEVVDLLLAQAGIEVNAKDCDKNTDASQVIHGIGIL